MTPPALAENEAYAKALKTFSTLPFRRPWSISVFLAEIAVMIGVPITVADLPEKLSAEKVTGLWIPNPLMHSIFVRHDAQGEYREHLICHEIAHIVMAHRPMGTAEVRDFLRSTFARVTPDLSHDLIDQLDPPQLCFARTDYLHPIEQEAEWLATLIMGRAQELRQELYNVPSGSGDAELLRRVAGLIGWRV